jgi:hypothetical protein
VGRTSPKMETWNENVVGREALWLS